MHRRGARYAFRILHACVNHGLAYIVRRYTMKIEGQARSHSRKESSTRLWQGSCCLACIMNAQLKIAVTSRAHSLARELVFARMQESELISASTKVFPAALPAAQRSSDPRADCARSLASVLLSLFPFPSALIVAQSVTRRESSIADAYRACAS